MTARARRKELERQLAAARSARRDKAAPEFNPTHLDNEIARLEVEVAYAQKAEAEAMAQETR